MQDLSPEKQERIEELKGLLIEEAVSLECNGVMHNCIRIIDGKKYKATFQVEEVA